MIDDMRSVINDFCVLLNCHVAQVAHFIVPAKVTHGHPLLCSYPACRDQGVKFCFCVHCNMPVAKRNFRNRHSHYELGPPQSALQNQDLGDAIDRYSASTLPPTAPEVYCQPAETSATHASSSSDQPKTPSVATKDIDNTGQPKDDSANLDGGDPSVENEEDEPTNESLHRSSKKKRKKKEKKRRRHHSRCRDIQDEDIDVEDDESDESSSYHRRRKRRRHRKLSSSSSRHSNSSSSYDHANRERKRKEKKRHKKSSKRSSSSSIPSPSRKRHHRLSSKKSTTTTDNVPATTLCSLSVDGQYNHYIKQVMSVMSTNRQNLDDEVKNHRLLEHQQQPVLLSSEGSLAGSL